MNCLARLSGLIVVVAAVAAVVAPASVAGAGTDAGLILFESDRGGHSDLWVMNPDGSNQVRLTDDKTEDVFAAWSPDGAKIAWTRGGRGPEGEIWVMNADGSDPTQLTFNQFDDFGAAWSPDGTKIAFRSTRNGNRDIYVMNATGGGEQRITTDPAADFSPDWSPDGTRIAFTRDSGGVCAVYTMLAGGGGEQKLTADELAAGPARWSPSGDQIVFTESFCSLSESDLFVMNPDGTAVEQITDTPENEIVNAWSPFGDKVACDLSRVVPGTRPVPGHLHKGDIGIVDVATGVVTNITNTKSVNEEHPDWSPVNFNPGA